MQKLKIQDFARLQTQEQFTKSRISELSGLPSEVVNEMYPSMSDKYHGNFSDQQIIAYYENLINDNKLAGQSQAELLSKLSNFDPKTLTTVNGQNEFMTKFVQLPETIDKLELVKQIISTTSEYESQKNIGVAFKPLYESLQMNLQHTSSYNNHDNMYQTIMANLDRKVQEKQLAEKIVSDDNSVYFDVLKGITTGTGGAFYTSMSNVEHIITDKQSLLMDLLVFTNKYIRLNEYDLKFVSMKTVREYNQAANALAGLILSSAHNARTLDFNPNNDKNMSVIDQLTNCIDETVYIKMEIDLYTVNQKAVTDAILMIFSMKHCFAVNIRRAISAYTTKAKQLVSDVDNARIARNMAGY